MQVQSWNGKCVEANARYAVPDQCDMYVECSDGIPEEKLCADGLFFNDKAGVYTFPCTYPIDVNCTTRARLQAAQVSIWYSYLFFFRNVKFVMNKTTNRLILFLHIKINRRKNMRFQNYEWIKWFIIIILANSRLPTSIWILRIGRRISLRLIHELCRRTRIQIGMSNWFGIQLIDIPGSYYSIMSQWIK